MIEKNVKKNSENNDDENMFYSSSTIWIIGGQPESLFLISDNETVWSEIIYDEEWDQKVC